jgi:hypothetical protein
VQAIEHRLMRDAQGGSELAGRRMWISREAMGENFIKSGDGGSSWSLFIRQVFSPSSNFRDPEEYLSFLHYFLPVNIAQATRDFLVAEALLDQESNHVPLFQREWKCDFSGITYLSESHLRRQIVAGHPISAGLFRDTKGCLHSSISTQLGLLGG